MTLELMLEKQYCFANPAMIHIIQELMQNGSHHLVITPDMYLSKSFLTELLSICGIKGYEKLYVSSEYKRNKESGLLFETLKEEYAMLSSIVHIGDNEYSDCKMAETVGITGALF